MARLMARNRGPHRRLMAPNVDSMRLRRAYLAYQDWGSDCGADHLLERRARVGSVRFERRPLRVLLRPDVRRRARAASREGVGVAEVTRVRVDLAQRRPYGLHECSELCGVVDDGACDLPRQDAL